MRIHDHLDYWAVRQPDATYAVDGDREITWADMQTWSCRVANHLAGRFAPGTRVAVLSKNSFEFLAFYYGAFRAGVVPVPLNFRLAGPEWRYIIEDAESAAVVVDAELAPAFEAIRAHLTIPCAVMGGTAPDGWESFDDAVATQPGTPPTVDVATDDDAYQMYTSGTTGHPKGAILTHRSVTENINQVVLGIGWHRTRAMVVMPMFHAGAAVACFAYTASGTSMSVVRDFDPSTVIRRLREERVNTVTLVPAMIQVLVGMPEVTGAPWPDLELVGYGASPIASEVLKVALEVFGCEFFQVFGMTETSAMATLLAPEDHRAALAGRPELLLSAGRAAPGTALRIVDAEDKDLPAGEIGEILVQGPQVMRGYWKLPEATEAALRDGWMHTGDAGRLDDEGYLFISDRIKDMVVSGGENVYPREVEEVLFGLAGVADASVIGVPDGRWGEALKAVVVVASGAELSETQVIEHCRAHLAGYKCPKSVDFVEALPLNATGKVLKRVLRAPYWDGHARGVN